MNNFTPDYIELAKKVQELKPELKEMDIICNKAGKILSIPSAPIVNLYRDYWCWLPTGDQLDEEIVKTMSKHKHYVYTVNYWFEQKMYSVIIDGSILREESNPNPLIAKIKLLIQLLEGE